MSSAFPLEPFDLVTPDGCITRIVASTANQLEVDISITDIPAHFAGFSLDERYILFNVKSTIAQLGIHAQLLTCTFSRNAGTVEARVRLLAVGDIGKHFLPLLTEGAYIGKLFAADPNRRVRDPDYLSRMFGRTDRLGKPLLALGNSHGKEDFKLEKIDGRTVAFLPLQEGCTTYKSEIFGFLPILAKALCNPGIKTRAYLKLSQEWQKGGMRQVTPGVCLLVNTIPLYIRTVYGRVVDKLLPHGVSHTAASILQPDTFASGDIFELFGEEKAMVSEIPLEFYTLEPYREHVFFSDRDQLQECVENEASLFAAMDTAPTPDHHNCATFVVKGEQLLSLSSKDWVCNETRATPFPGLLDPQRHMALVDEYIENQPTYPFLEAMERGSITSQGIILSRYLPSPLTKRMLLSKYVIELVKGIYFQCPSRTHGYFFSHEDRALLFDLAKFGIPTYWLDQISKQVLQYVAKPGKDSGMFVPLKHVKAFTDATMIGVYGSVFVEGEFERFLVELLQGLLALRNEVNHPLLAPGTPLALVTGGGPGAMLDGNKAARATGILSCANVVDFTKAPESLSEQEVNPYIDAKMTYRIDKLVERQAEFHLDLPIFLKGGIGTDFEYALENVRRKVGATRPTPILLVGPPSYWKEKITPGYTLNLHSGTINGSEWISNCFYCVETPMQALSVYRRYFSGQLQIGQKGPIYREGFTVVT